MNDRIYDLENLLKEDPDDPFLYYVLGLEYIKEGQLDQALSKFEFILKKFPAYLPVYYQATQLLIEMGDVEKVIKTFEDGISLAVSQSDSKTLQELKNAYNDFMIDRDDEM